MGMNEDRMNKLGYDIKNLEHNYQFNVTKLVIERIFGASESLFVIDTYQFDDYSKYVATAFNPQEKAARRKEEFPKDCERAFEMGARFAAGGELGWN